MDAPIIIISSQNLSTEMYYLSCPIEPYWTGTIKFFPRNFHAVGSLSLYLSLSLCVSVCAQCVFHRWTILVKQIRPHFISPAALYTHTTEAIHWSFSALNICSPELPTPSGHVRRTSKEAGRRKNNKTGHAWSLTPQSTLAFCTLQNFVRSFVKSNVWQSL